MITCSHSGIRSSYMPTILVASGYLLLAIPALADKGEEHQVAQTFFGVSGSTISFIGTDNGSYCFTGTLGSLVTGGGKTYILSNNHVLAQENLNEANPGHMIAVGQFIIQPGLLDENGDDKSCSATDTVYTGLEVGQLSNFVPLVFGGAENLVDAAIAEVDVGTMDSRGRILDIGGIGGSTVPGEVGLAVQKSGRTTGHTIGTIGAVNANVTVGYDGGSVYFVDQIIVSANKGPFIKGE